MTVNPCFTEVIRSEQELRAVMGFPLPHARNKEIAQLDGHCRAFIGRSPFVLVSSHDAAGNMDISPKGDPPGFVHIIDDRSLAIPDRPGNRRGDTFSNVLQRPHVGLLFFVPGKPETLRVSGQAIIVRDRDLRERMATHGKVPELALFVAVEQVFFHCAKCVLRSQLWNSEAWPALEGLSSHASCLVDHAKLQVSVAEMQARLDTNNSTQLY
jgi:uncharacterized protein